MARTDTQFKNGNAGGPGRPKGRKNTVPGSFKESLRRVFEDVWRKDPTIFKQAVCNGLKARPPTSFQYLQLAHYYGLGKPKETVDLKGRIVGPPIVIVPPDKGKK